jgi:hypothetical protein
MTRITYFAAVLRCIVMSQCLREVYTYERGQSDHQA